MKPICMNNFCKMKTIPVGDRAKTKLIPICQEIPKLVSANILNSISFDM